MVATTRTPSYFLIAFKILRGKLLGILMIIV